MPTLLEIAIFQQLKPQVVNCGPSGSADIRVRRHVKVGLAILILGLSPLIYTTYRAHSHNWIPLSVSLTLHPGEFRSPEFETDLSGTYIISLVFDNTLATGKEDCMMGEDFPKGSCGSGARTLFLEWSVAGVSGSTSPAAYEPHAYSGSLGGTETEVGRFEAKRGERQRIVLNILTDAGELNAAHPKLMVEAHRMYWEKWVILGQLAFLCAIALSAVGIGSMVLPLFFRRSKSHSAQAE